MQHITRVNHIGLRIRHFETTLAFYSQLGFQLISKPSAQVPVAVVEHPSGININFIINGRQPEAINVLMDVEEKDTGYTHVALEVNDADAVIDELTQLGIPLSGDEQHPEGRSVFIRDPDRNVLEFYQPANH